MFRRSDEIGHLSGWSEPFDQFMKDFVNMGRIGIGTCQLELLECGMEFGPLDQRLIRGHDQRMSCLGDVATDQQFFIKFFTRPQPGEDDLDVTMVT